MEKAKAILLKTDLYNNNNYYEDLLKDALLTPTQPISPLGFTQIDDRQKICVKKDIMDELEILRKLVEVNRTEVSFVLLAHKLHGKDIWIDKLIEGDCLTTKDKNLFLKHIERYEARKGKSIIIAGHARPFSMDYADNVYLNDLEELLELREEHQSLKSGDKELLGLSLTPSGDTNFYRYDGQKFSKYSRVLKDYGYGNLVEVSAYEKGYYLENGTKRLKKTR